MRRVQLLLPPWAGAHGGSITESDDNLVELWNGSAFTMQSAPNRPPSPAARLSGVSCFGRDLVHGRAARPYLERRGSLSDTQGQTWDGQSWAACRRPTGPVSTHR